MDSGHKRWIDLAKTVAILILISGQLFGNLYQIEEMLTLSVAGETLFIFISGITTGFSMSRYNTSGSRWAYIFRNEMHVFIPYVVSTLLIIAYNNNGSIDPFAFIKNLAFFSAAPSFPFVLVYMQLMLCSICLYRFALPSNGFLKSIAAILIVYFAADWLGEYSIVPGVTGSGYRLFGGSFLFVYFLGMLFQVNMDFFNKRKNNLALTMLSIVTLTLMTSIPLVDRMTGTPPNKYLVLFVMMLFILIYSFKNIFTANCMHMDLPKRIAATISNGSFYILLFGYFSARIAGNIYSFLFIIDNKTLICIWQLIWAIALPIVVLMTGRQIKLLFMGHRCPFGDDLIPKCRITAHQLINLVKTRAFWLYFLHIQATFMLLAITLWTMETFDEPSFEQIIFHLHVPITGSESAFYYSFIIKCLFVPSVMAFSCLLFYLSHKTATIGKNGSVSNSQASIAAKIYTSIHINHIEPIILFILILAVCVFTWYSLGINRYAMGRMNSTTFIEDNYQDPRHVKINFPAKKRNLIYIFLESVETTYLSTELGGARQVNLMPELSRLAIENINFSNTNLLGGALRVPGTGWTIAEMVAQSSGLPLRLPIDGNSYNIYDSFLPGAYTLGDILDDQGYNQTLMVGSDANFGGRRGYYENHGHYRIFDYFTAIEEKRIKPDYMVWWGFEDHKLFEFAKEELTRLENDDEPFNLTLLTVDTHHIGGYVCSYCQTVHDNQFENVISCQSRQVAEFVGWIKTQDFYSDTLIVIAGDHQSMDPNYFLDISDSYIRTPINIFINSSVDAKSVKLRQFSSFDLFPTTLAGLGVDIKGERLGLGTNLFSEQPTLIEEFGIGEFRSQLDAGSNFYNEFILYSR